MEPAPGRLAGSAGSAGPAITLACRALVYRRAHARILDAIDLDFAAGENVSLLGVNGAGKSTLLRLLLGLIAPAAGEVRLDGRPLGAWRRRDIARRLAYVPQSHVAAFPYTVLQMVTLGRVPHAGLGRALARDDRDAIDAALERVDLAHLAHRDYTRLSGGERQRVLLARALAQQAPMLVMDEPLSGLDFGHQLRMLTLFAELAADGYTILHTSHRPDDAFHGSTRAILLDRGRVIADGAPHAVVDAAAISALYGIPVAQADVDRYRFFLHDAL
ncbi:MAG: ABC transporter ATP-binding protein [Janthinobacterium lividum]